MEISIIVPDRVFYKGITGEVILPTLAGQMGILKNHIPLLTGLDVGLILVRKQDSNNWIPVIATGGFALINSNKVTILVNEAELGSELNAEEVQSNFLSAKVSAESSLEGKKKIEALSQFKRAKARIQALSYI